ncbi:MAG: hypothetical protein IT349_02160 [Candidatus Eisenbacteria bacterium]|nr:hypothetical protein [Candidatus Eisenbacteria bacterium]
MTALESLGRVRLQALLLLLVVFVIGGLTGAAFERTRRVGPPRFVEGGRDPGRAFSERMRHEIGLSDTQATRIDAILERGRPRMQAAMERARPLVQSVSDSIRAEVRLILTPDQQRRFDQLEPPLGPPMLDGRRGGAPFGGPPHGRPFRGRHPGPPGPFGVPPGGPPPEPPSGETKPPKQTG